MFKEEPDSTHLCPEMNSYKIQIAIPELRRERKNAYTSHHLKLIWVVPFQLPLFPEHAWTAAKRIIKMGSLSIKAWALFFSSQLHEKPASQVQILAHLVQPCIFYTSQLLTEKVCTQIKVAGDQTFAF